MVGDALQRYFLKRRTNCDSGNRTEITLSTFLYLIKYRTWISLGVCAPLGSMVLISIIYFVGRGAMIAGTDEDKISSFVSIIVALNGIWALALIKQSYYINAAAEFLRSISERNRFVFVNNAHTTLPPELADKIIGTPAQFLMQVDNLIYATILIERRGAGSGSRLTYSWLFVVRPLSINASRIKIASDTFGKTHDLLSVVVGPTWYLVFRESLNSETVVIDILEQVKRAVR